MAPTSWQLIERSAHLAFPTRPRTKDELTKLDGWVTSRLGLKPEDAAGISALLLASWDHYESPEETSQGIVAATLAATVLRHVESLGYAVTITRCDGRVDLQAHKLGEGHVARCLDGDADEHLYRAAVELALSVGIDLADG